MHLDDLISDLQALRSAYPNAGWWNVCVEGGRVGDADDDRSVIAAEVSKEVGGRKESIVRLVLGH